MGRRLFGALLTSALLLLWLGSFTDIDLVLARAAYDPELRTFPWRHAWLAETLGHSLVRGPLIAFGLGWVTTAAVLRLSTWGKAVHDARHARIYFVGLSAFLVPATVALLKHLSTAYCPWDLAMFGGLHQYIVLLGPAAVSEFPGQCMPAGHASSALWMMSLAVFCLPDNPRRAAMVAGTALAFGVLLGWVQQLRGAHFLSHTLWSIWIAVAIIGVLWCWLMREAEPEPARRMVLEGQF